MRASPHTMLRTGAVLIAFLLASPAGAHLFPYQLSDAYGPNNHSDATERACSPGDGCYTRRGALCADVPGALCDLQVVPAGRCAEGDPASGNLWPAKAGACHDDPNVACLADAPFADRDAGACAANQESCLFDSVMCADVPDTTPADNHPTGLCDMTTHDVTAACSSDPDAATFEVLVCGGGGSVARCSDGDVAGLADGGLGTAECRSIGDGLGGATSGACGPASGKAFPDGGRYELENPPGARAQLQRSPGSIGSGFSGAIVDTRATFGVEIDISPDASGVRRIRIPSETVWEDFRYELASVNGQRFSTLRAEQPCRVPLGWRPDLPVSGVCDDGATFCIEDANCAGTPLQQCESTQFCRAAGSDGFGMLFTRDLLPVELTGECAPDCGRDLDHTTFELEELTRIHSLDEQAGVQAALESLEGDRAGEGDVLLVRGWDTPLFHDPPIDGRCHIGGDPDPVTNPSGFSGRCSHDETPCEPGDPANGDALCALAGGAGSECHACAVDPAYDARGLPELDLAAHARIGLVASGALPGNQLVADAVVSVVTIDTSGKASAEFRDDASGGAADVDGLGPATGGAPGIDLASGRTAFALGEALPHQPGATSGAAIAIDPETPGTPVGVLARVADHGPGADGIPGCPGDNALDGTPCDELLGDPGTAGNSGADDVASSISIGGAPAVAGIQARFKARDANGAAVAYFSSSQGSVYGYTDPNPPTFNTVAASAVRDLNAAGLAAARDSLTKSDRVWCPLVGGVPECTRSCVPGGSEDFDCDGIPDVSDNCPFWPTALLDDTNGDGRGDACQCGDANGDGLINVSDILTANSGIFDPTQVGVLCDATGDGLCNVSDILAINSAIFGLVTPVCSRHPVVP